MKKESQQMDMKDAFPVFKFNYNGKLLDCNTTAKPLLNHWHCKKGSKLPAGLMKSCPEMKFAMKNPQPTECKVKFGDFQIWCDIVPYPEAGYIGIYGYHIDSALLQEQKYQLRLAS